MTWIDESAKSSDLLYLSEATVSGGKIEIYTFPTAKLVGEIASAAQSPCSDKYGDVWVPEGDEIFAYAHGRMKPYKSLAAQSPWGCAIDRTSGDLAVASTVAGSKNGNVRIYPSATGTPRVYDDGSVEGFQYCVYDGEGNLFLTGSDAYGAVLVELPKHQSTFVKYGIGKPEGDRPIGGVQWDGTNLVIGFVGVPKLYQYRIGKGEATQVGRINLELGAGLTQFWIQNKRVVVPGTSQDGSGSFGIWRYPAGGKRGKHHSISPPLGVTVSVASK